MEIKIRDEFIKLGQALKLAGVVEDGVEAKYAIQDGLVASIRIHSRIGIVVLDGTAFKDIFTLFKRLLLEQMIFMMCITPFLFQNWLYK